MLKFFDSEQATEPELVLDLERAKAKKSRTKRHHMTVEINKQTWAEFITTLPTSSFSSLKDHPLYTLKEPPVVSLKAPSELKNATGTTGITPWIENIKYCAALRKDELVRSWSPIHFFLSRVTDAFARTVRQRPTVAQIASFCLMLWVTLVQRTLCPQRRIYLMTRTAKCRRRLRQRSHPRRPARDQSHLASDPFHPCEVMGLPMI